MLARPKASKAVHITIHARSGKSGFKDVRDLRGVLEREKAAMGVLISLQPPMRDMVTETVSAGFYWQKTIPELAQAMSPDKHRRPSAALVCSRFPASSVTPWTFVARRLTKAHVVMLGFMTVPGYGVNTP